MSMTIAFVRVGTDQVKAVQLKPGSIIPQKNDLIVSPFCPERLARITEVDTAHVTPYIHVLEVSNRECGEAPGHLDTLKGTMATQGQNSH
jgi:hypothetical protein